ncbi:MAG TPA: methyltransferase domain-containing protein [Clostridiaceae bacterium]|nr:methyltransferase domain-containing protein [Clostridiaceae bacterium]
MDREILNLEEAAELFGVSIKTFIKLLKEEKVPARKIGREWRFSRKALIDWLSSGDSQAYSASEGDPREFFDRVAPEWEQLSKICYDESIRNKLFELNLLDENMTVLDLGSGDGYLSRAVAAYVKKVIAVDISGEMLNELKKKAKAAGISNIEAIESDGQDVPLDDSSVEMVCANMYLHHIEEPNIAIGEMYRLVKPGGKVFVADFCIHKNEEFKEKMHDIWTGFKRQEIKKWFNDNGFTNIQIETFQANVDSGIVSPKDRMNIFVLTAEKPLDSE